jgi:hypothetical protein
MSELLDRHTEQVQELVQAALEGRVHLVECEERVKTKGTMGDVVLGPRTVVLLCVKKDGQLSPIAKMVRPDEHLGRIEL